MTTEISMATRTREENWLPVLELAVEEVFEIMLGCRVRPLPKADHPPEEEFTAMVGLAGAICGILTVSCDGKNAAEMARCMLGAPAESEDQVADALGEICNMVAGNFESGSAQMKSASQGAMDLIANLLRQRDYRLRIEGHTDNVPIHTAQFPSNWELSTARATEIVRVLIVRDGFGPDRLSAAGYAEYHPVASNRTGEGRGVNRRVDIVILGGGGTEAPDSQVGAVTASADPTAPGSATSPAGAALKPAAATSNGVKLQH
jgi:OmpA family/Chemotaxis phosphatase CheX